MLSLSSVIRTEGLTFPLEFLISKALNSQAYFILDEVLMAGELQESSKKSVARVIAAQASHCLDNLFHFLAWLACL